MAPVNLEEQVGEANRAFYGAFEARDLEAMGRVWERSGRVSVTHPGWPTLRGWDRVAGSWRAIFANTPYIQFFLTDEEINVAGEVAWVTLYENILQELSGSAGSEGQLGEAQVAATNVYVHGVDGWRMVIHHASPVLSSAGGA
jgi:ketosteroid isomerase-like protein